MISFRPTRIEQYAIEAKLNLMFGANVYDRIFLGFEVLEIVDGELRGWAPTEYGSAVIDVHYASKLAWIAGTGFRRPIRRANVAVRGFKHHTAEQPLCAHGTHQ